MLRKQVWQLCACVNHTETLQQSTCKRAVLSVTKVVCCVVWKLSWCVVVVSLTQIKTADKEIFAAVRSQSNTQARSRWVPVPTTHWLRHLLQQCTAAFLVSLPRTSVGNKSAVAQTASLAQQFQPSTSQNMFFAAVTTGTLGRVWRPFWPLMFWLGRTQSLCSLHCMGCIFVCGGI
jgi:hypothetical protein